MLVRAMAGHYRIARWYRFTRVLPGVCAERDDEHDHIIFNRYNIIEAGLSFVSS